MEKIILSAQQIISEVLTYTPILSLFMLPVTRARNLPKTEDRAHEEEYQTQGRELYQLAQDVNHLNAAAPGPATPSALQVNTVTQAALAGLYLSHRLSPQLENSLRAGNEIKNQFNKDAFAYPPPLPYITDNYLPNEEPNDILAIENYPQLPRPVKFLPNHTLQWEQDTRLFPNPNRQHPVVAPPSLPSGFISPPHSSLFPNAMVGGNVTQPERSLAIAPRKPFPRTKYPFSKSYRAKKYPGANSLKKTSATKWLPNNEVIPEQYYSGWVVEQAETPLTAVEEQTASKSRQPQAKERISAPEGNVPEPPVLEDFMHPEEAARQGEPALENDIPAPPVPEDFMHPEEAARQGEPGLEDSIPAPPVPEDFMHPQEAARQAPSVAGDHIPDPPPRLKRSPSLPRPKR
ncbi:hypothetical protein ABK905_22610 [Acerihabitans sp. KWT182]|uniref:Uncharacterized protein n=1 Tax=Acerihabitans sp. KWT182 TaxID=3157919 RepID=A0AAU7Q945_9GAMM